MDTKTYRKIKAYSIKAMERSTDFQHMEDHLLRVENNAKKIVGVLGLQNEIDLNLLGSICYLHDLSYTKHKHGLVNYIREGNRVKELVKNLLEDYDIPIEEKTIIIRAVWKHTLSFPFRRLNKKEGNYAKILQDADTIDFFAPVRLLRLVESAKRSFWYKTMKVFSKKVPRWAIRHIGLFLNFPQLAKEFYSN